MAKVNLTTSATVATVDRIHLDPATAGCFGLPGITAESAAAVSECLTENHKKHHVFFNEHGYHNHIVHLLLALYSTGAPASLIRASYTRETSYQRPIDVDKDQPATPAPHTLLDPASTDPQKWTEHLGNRSAYTAFLHYYKTRIASIGWREAVRESLCGGTEAADDMLVRLYSGFLHPLIHLGYGVEFEQPAIVAEALAMTAVHDNWIGELLRDAEIKAELEGKEEGKEYTIVELLDMIRADEGLRNAPNWADANKIQGILERAPDKMVRYAAMYRVKEEQMEEKVTEAINAAALFTGAAQRRDKEIKIDFYYMHSLNSSIFLPILTTLSFLPLASRIRLLEWKVRVDLALYASRRAPELLVHEIASYVPKVKTDGNPWLRVLERIQNIDDDGHAVKLIRALWVGERREASSDGKKGLVMRGDMWAMMGHMVVDSVEAPGTRWASSVGFDEAWEGYGPRPQY